MTRASARAGDRASARGAALVVALTLLMILTLLAVTGMSMSTAELVMAGNEQYRRIASDAASAGIERAVARLAAAPANRVTTSIRGEPTEASDPRSGPYLASTRFVGEEWNLPGSSADKFVGLHFEIESTGKSARRASDVQVQGAMVVEPQSGVATQRRLAEGLQ